MISLLVAHDKNYVIGFQNAMPWHIPEELQYFKKVSMNKAVIMGRKTFESIGRPLPGRLNIVITRNEDYEAEGITVVHSLEDALEAAKDYSEEKVVIGGAEIFKLALPIADRLYSTVIDHEFEGDTYFPSYKNDWKVVSASEDHFTKDGIQYTYYVFERL